MKLDLTGQRYGKLTVLSSAENKGRYTAWLCKCDCGNEKIILTNALRSGRSKSCGCGISESVKARMTKYSTHDYRLYHIWYGMHERCENKRHKSYHRYGGRGITICDEWKDFEAFAGWATTNGYDDKLSLDRIDNDGNYEPSNCRWVTEIIQHRNTSMCRYETINGVTKCVSEWAEEYGVRHGLVHHRLLRGIPIEEALTVPPKNTNKGMPVRCIDTGEVFSSSKEAAKKYGRTTSAIARAARSGRPSCGMRWEQVWISEK